MTISSQTSDTNSKLALDKTPFYIPVNSTYTKKKTANGVEESDIATIKRYYSPIDAEIYFGDYYVEDIVDINFAISQQNIPIFGYNSYTTDQIVVGSRILSGQFTINFTSPGYLFKLLSMAKSSSTLPSDTSSYILSQKERNNLLPKGKQDTYYKGEIAGDNTKELWPETFDIDVVYGQKSDAGDAVHLVIEGVRILSCQQGASAHANVPATENYSFIAKDYKVLS